MYSQHSPTFSLENFEGPLELLLYLIQKDEIDICSISIKDLTMQFLQTLEALPEVENSCETLSLAASLLVIKSQKLLPSDGSVSEELEEDPRMELIQSLIEYCRLKDAAKLLSLKEEEQKGYFSRATPPFQKELGTGLEEIGIDHLKSLLNELLKKVPPSGKVIKQEEWQVSAKLKWFRETLIPTQKIAFTSLFSEERSREELIVFFLALLELMKHQEAMVVKENEILYIIPYESRT